MDRRHGGPSHDDAAAKARPRVKFKSSTAASLSRALRLQGHRARRWYDSDAGRPGAEPEVPLAARLRLSPSRLGPSAVAGTAACAVARRHCSCHRDGPAVPGPRRPGPGLARAAGAGLSTVTAVPVTESLGIVTPTMITGRISVPVRFRGPRARAGPGPAAYAGDSGVSLKPLAKLSFGAGRGLAGPAGGRAAVTVALSRLSRARAGPGRGAPWPAPAASRPPAGSQPEDGHSH